jgi:hypothetical protein
MAAVDGRGSQSAASEVAHRRQSLAKLLSPVN